MSKLIEKKVDKFHNKTELVTKQVTLWSNSKLYDYGLSWQRNDIKAKFRYWSDDKEEAFLLDVDYGGPEWMFLREGDMVIRINDTKNIEIKPSGEDADVKSNEGNKIICREVLYYRVNKEDFIDICNATSLEFQISGGRTFVNGRAEQLQAIGRILYNDLYGKDLPVEVQERVGWLIPMTLGITAVNTLVLEGFCCEMSNFCYNGHFDIAEIPLLFGWSSWGVWLLLLALVVGGEVFIYKKSKNAAKLSTIIAIILPILFWMLLFNL